MDAIGLLTSTPAWQVKYISYQVYISISQWKKDVTTLLMHWSYAFLASTHWGRVTQICVGKLTIIGADNGLSPGRRQVIIWTNAGVLLIGPLGTNFSEILIEIYIFSFKKMHLKMSSGKWLPFCLGLNVLTHPIHVNLSSNTLSSMMTSWHEDPFCILIASLVAAWVIKLTTSNANNNDKVFSVWV